MPGGNIAAPRRSASSPCSRRWSGLYFVWSPGQATRLAEIAGIGRGVDLFLYLWVVISLLMLLNLHLRLRMQMEVMTELARALAIANARSGAPAKPR